MNTKIVYKLLSGFYDLIDVIYFHNYENSPRKVVQDAIREKDRVLDLCTGTASNAIRIAKSNPTAKIAGVDMSKDMLKVAGEKLAREHIRNVKLYCMDATRLSFRNQCFDKVTISLVLHELDEALCDQLIQEAKRVLKDDGSILVMEWEPSTEWWRKCLFLPIHLLEPKPYRTFIKKDLKRYFHKHGLKVTKTRHCDYTKVLELQKEN